MSEHIIRSKDVMQNEITRFGKRTGGYVFIDNKRVDIKANIHELSGYSAHADQVELIQWVNAIEQKPELIQLVHGQTDSQQALKIKLNDYGYQVETCVQRH
jgi:Predicted metal-dependent RNase, consists of a metallo-beta-lactamase domain and an RNA-binding KH domain